MFVHIVHSMTAIIFCSRQILTPKKFRGFVSATHKYFDRFKVEVFSKEVCEMILDQYPDIKTLNKLHSKIVVNEDLRIDPALAIKLMRAYAAYGETSVTRCIFDSTLERNVVFFNVMIRSYVNNNMYVEALSIYQGMSSFAFNPDHYTFPCVLKACSGLDNLRVGLQVHDAILKVGLGSNLFIGNALVAMYGKCGCLREARKVLDQMPYRDVVSWNSMVAGYAQSGQFDNALEICKEMGSLKLNHNAGTMASLLPAVCYTSSENVQYIHNMFERMARKSLVSWNVMIAIYVNNSMPNEAVSLFLQMEGCGMKPDAITIASLLPACGDLSALFLGRRLHKYIVKDNLRPNLLLENALIDMYAKCGCLEEARDVFDKMKLRDVVSWTSMMSAYGRSGRGYDAVALFAKMLDSGLNPDSIAFVSVLSACSHAGLLDQGRHYFHVMMEQYRIVPRIEHFACMVDLFGRAGEVEEAYSFIKKMPMEPNERVWGALLSACRVHSKMDIGLVAADCLLQLAPKQSSYYVLLSNIYAKAGMWKDVMDVRYAMKNLGIKKVPGISNVELNGQVHTFLAGDQYHPQAKNIYEELDVLVGKMKELGYIPQTESALHDVEVEDKECHLAIHSEKLAIVFAILNTRHGTPIRITKNLRVCGDCHIAIKLMSKLVSRDIIVRDCNRFHHFSNGICSCGDYW
ncbi:putative pentatricopeptide repeat-containing protein At3g49142 [Benincasa hispida]|uniref:putative pentatricopeptide repeat-containing protein At3g49142 n=1 Tax=Benincasa hispida TaxID=102211 RepID=UPI001901FCB3|nr:putative pentatricopeptide repeat-containing protein At3g49142 [Benincasa hispida]